ncbi:MAG: HD domain-containing protein [Bacteroidota bacterium]
MTEEYLPYGNDFSACVRGKIFDAVADVAANSGVRAYVVGGYVRDYLLNKPCKDIDFVVLGSGIDFARMVADKLHIHHVSCFKNFGTAHFILNDCEIEFVGARKESYRAESRKPIVETGSLEDDLARRDFTVNTLTVSLNRDDFGKLHDLFGGINDLEKKTLRTPLEPGITFSDDPLRMMRALRFSAQLLFGIEQKTLNAITEQCDRIKIVSQERITDELNKIILSPIPSVGFTQLLNTGLIKHIFPQFAALQGVENNQGISHKDNYYHTIAVLDNVARHSTDLWLRWAALLHDIGKPSTKHFDQKLGWTFHGHDARGSRMVKKIFEQMRLPLNEKMNYVKKLVALHLRPIVLSEDIVTDSAIRRLLFDAGDDIDDLMTLCEADITSKNQAKVKTYLKNFAIVREKLKEIEAKDKLRNWQPPISGDDIQKAFGIEPGPKVGIIKTAIREAILDGVIQNDFAEAYNFMLLKGKELGLSKIAK